MKGRRWSWAELERDAVGSGAGESGAGQYWSGLAVSYTTYRGVSNTQEDRPKRQLAWTIRWDLTLIECNSYNRKNIVEIYPARLRSLVVVVGENAEMTCHIHGYYPWGWPCTTRGNRSFIHIQQLQDQASLAQENGWPVHVTALAVQLNQGYVVHVFPKVKLMCIICKKSPTSKKLLKSLSNWIWFQTMITTKLLLSSRYFST